MCAQRMLISRDRMCRPRMPWAVDFLGVMGVSSPLPQALTHVSGDVRGHLWAVTIWGTGL